MNIFMGLHNDGGVSVVVTDGERQYTFRKLTGDANDHLFIDGYACNERVPREVMDVFGSWLARHHAPANMRVGASNAPDSYFTGALYELFVFSTAISTTDRAALESYLNAKWTIY